MSLSEDVQAMIDSGFYADIEAMEEWKARIAGLEGELSRSELNLFESSTYRADAERWRALLKLQTEYKEIQAFLGINDAIELVEMLMREAIDAAREGVDMSDISKGPQRG